MPIPEQSPFFTAPAAEGAQSFDVPVIPGPDRPGDTLAPRPHFSTDIAPYGPDEAPFGTSAERSLMRVTNPRLRAAFRYRTVQTVAADTLAQTAGDFTALLEDTGDTPVLRATATAALRPLGALVHEVVQEHLNGTSTAAEASPPLIAPPAAPPHRAIGRAVMPAPPAETPAPPPVVVAGIEGLAMVGDTILLDGRPLHPGLLRYRHISGQYAQLLPFMRDYATLPPEREHERAGLTQRIAWLTGGLRHMVAAVMTNPAAHTNFLDVENIDPTAPPTYDTGGQGVAAAVDTESTLRLLMGMRNSDW